MDLQSSDKALEIYLDFFFFDGCGPWEGGALRLRTGKRLERVVQTSCGERDLEEWARLQHARSRDLVPFEIVCHVSYQLVNAPPPVKVHLADFLTCGRLFL